MLSSTFGMELMQALFTRILCKAPLCFSKVFYLLELVDVATYSSGGNQFCLEQVLLDLEDGNTPPPMILIQKLVMEKLFTPSSRVKGRTVVRKVIFHLAICSECFLVMSHS